MAAPRPLPKDAIVMNAILKDMGVSEYEPRVINQMLEFTYRYVTNILDDSRVYANHAKKKNIDTDDVKLAVSMQLERSFISPPPRDMLLELARTKNAVPLPEIKRLCGIHLPPDRYCLSACNYKLKSTKRPANTQIQSKQISLGTSFPTGRLNTLTTTPKISTAVSITKPPTSMSLQVPRQPITQAGKVISVPKPVIKVSTPVTVPKPVIKMESEEIIETGVKRKREDDDDYDLGI